MPDAARQDQIVDMVKYLRDTISKIDRVMTYWQKQRTELAVRLANLQAATDPSLRRVADDYSTRVAQGRPYEDARRAEDIISEAHRRLKP